MNLFVFAIIFGYMVAVITMIVYHSSDWQGVKKFWKRQVVQLMRIGQNNGDHSKF